MPIPKPKKDITHKESYRAVSHINTNKKIPQQNVSNPNPERYKKDSTPGPSGIYYRNKKFGSKKQSCWRCC